MLSKEELLSITMFISCIIWFAADLSRFCQELCGLIEAGRVSATPVLDKTEAQKVGAHKGGSLEVVVSDHRLCH